ncbi:hypothetical protein HDV00_005453 [Rhizophlyctis rosea]|nr:hypothetical protein HDV00_005453 [Rhizophlyctis rosea]
MQRLWLFDLVVIYFTGPTFANFLKCNYINHFEDWSWAQSHQVIAPSAYPAPLPSSYPLLAEVYQVVGEGSWDAFEMRAVSTPYVSSSNSTYKTLTVNIFSSNSTLDQLYFDLSTSSAASTNEKPLPSAAGVSQMSLNAWNTFTIDLDSYYTTYGTANAEFRSVLIKTPPGTNGTVYYVFAYLGNPADFVLAPRYVTPPYYVNGVPTQLSNDGLQFVTSNDSFRPDTGVFPQWSCYAPARRGFSNLNDISIHAWRDTTTGAVPMNLSVGIQYEENNLLIDNMWGGDYGAPTMTFNAIDYPTPLYACTVFNGDFYIIGNMATAKTILYIWAPFYQDNLNLYLAAFATYVKIKRDRDGINVVVYVRQQIPLKYWGPNDYLRSEFWG